MNANEQIADGRNLATILETAVKKLPESTKARIVGIIEGAIIVHEMTESEKAS